MKKLSLVYSLTSLLVLTPSFVYAVETDGIMTTGFGTFVENIVAVLDLLVVLIIALAVVFFLWGVAKFILNAGDPEEQSKGKSIMFWGLIGLFVMTAVWGLINFLGDAFGLTDDSASVPNLPTI